jgi:hypothetical protein
MSNLTNWTGIATSRHSASRVGIASAFLSLVAVGVVGCAGKSTNETPTEEALVTRGEIARSGGNSPPGVVLQLWRTVQVGDVPSALSYYHPRVRSAVGLRNIVGVLAQQRSSLSVLRPRIVSVSRTPLGTEVVVSARSGGSGVGLLSFLLRNAEGGWRVAHDTLLGDALPGYVESAVQARVAPGSNAPSPVAQLAGVRASEVYRTLFASTLRPARTSIP